MPFDLGLFDVMQVDPLRNLSLHEVYRSRLDDLQLAEALGFSIAFCAERHFTPLCQCPAPGAWLGAASQRTSTMRLGALAYTLPIHDPVLLAEEIALLDQLTGGRLEIGFGLGHRVEELIGLGVNPARRIDIFQERLAIVEALWSGGRISIDSDFNTIHDVAIHPLTVQTPHPPIWYAGTDPGGIRWAASRGMSVAIGFRPTRELAPAAEAFHAGRAEWLETQGDGNARAGRLALMRRVYIAESDEQAFAEMSDDIFQLGALQGDEESDRAERRDRAAEGAMRVVTDEIYIAGGPTTVARTIHQARERLGLDLFLADVYGGGIAPERVRHTLRLLAGPVRELLDTALVSR